MRSFDSNSNEDSNSNDQHNSPSREINHESNGVSLLVNNQEAIPDAGPAAEVRQQLLNTAVDDSNLEGTSQSTNNSETISTPVRATGRKRRPNQFLDKYHVHSQKKGEMFQQFELAFHRAGAPEVNTVTPTRKVRSRSRSAAGCNSGVKRSCSNKRQALGHISVSRNGVNVAVADRRTRVRDELSEAGTSVSVNDEVEVDATTPIGRPRPHIPSQQKWFASRVWYRWKEKRGGVLDRALHKAIVDETGKNMKNGTASKRRIDLELFAGWLWAALCFVYVRRFLKTRAKALVQCVFRVLLEQYPELFKEELLFESRRFMRREVFQAWKFQRTIDLYATGGLNYEACNTIREGVECLGRYKRGVIPSGASIARAASLLEAYAAEMHGLEIQDSMSKHGPSYSFDLDIYARLIFDGFGLSQYAVTGSTAKPVLIAETLDGAQLTHYLGHVTGGFKIVDPRAMDPITGLPLCLIQSRDLCFPFQITFGRDCKDLYKDCFSYAHGRFREGFVVPSAVGLPELSNFKVVSPQDLASIWKTTGLGGGSHSTELFCFACMCSKDSMSLYKTGEQRCTDCSRLAINKCFCHPIMDTNHVDDQRNMLLAYADDALEDCYRKLDNIAERSTILTDETQADRFENKLHIDYRPNNRQEKKCFMGFIGSEIELRMQGRQQLLNSVLMTGLEERRIKLKSMIADEVQLDYCRRTVSRLENANDMVEKLTVGEAIPCILHMENRINEKLVWTLFCQAMDRYPDGDAKTRKILIERVNECMQSVVLGDAKTGRQSQWKLPLKDNGKQVDPRSLTNTHSRKCVMGLKTIASIVFSADLDEKSLTPQQTRLNNSKLEAKWHSVMDCYVPMMVKIRQHDEFTDDDIDSLHTQAARFMDLWVDLQEGQCITNYIHIVGAGHLTFYLRRYRNLYRYSQQGWEALNQKLKHFYFNNTNHGGCGGNSSGEMITGNHVRPLMRLCQRFVMWRLGLGDDFFLSNVSLDYEDDENEAECEPMVTAGEPITTRDGLEFAAL